MLKPLYLVTDCDNQKRFIQAESFSDAAKKFLEWETPNDPADAQEETELIRSLELVGELIDGGTRETDFS